MGEDVLIPKMKRLEPKDREIKIPWLNLALIIFCTLLIIGATFLNIDIKHYIIPSDLFSNKNLTADDFIFSFYYIPQIPIIMFICSFLGKRMGLVSIVFYILLGLFFIPIFALGGGIKYIFEYGFGYILAYIPAVIIAGNILEKKYSYPNMIKATIFGVLIIHIIGIIYMAFIALIKGSGIDFITGWIVAQSGLKIIYDLIASFVLILIGKYLNTGIKFVL